MEPGIEQPYFILDEDAPPGTQEAFDNLVRLVKEQPDASKAVFAAAGGTPAEIVARTNRLDEDDKSYAAQTLQAVSRIFEDGMDSDVVLPAADALMRWLVEKNPQTTYGERRVRRIGFFIGSVASRAEANRPQAA